MRFCNQPKIVSFVIREKSMHPNEYAHEPECNHENIHENELEREKEHEHENEHEYEQEHEHEHEHARELGVLVLLTLILTRVAICGSHFFEAQFHQKS